MLNHATTRTPKHKRTIVDETMIATAVKAARNAREERAIDVRGLVGAFVDVIDAMDAEDFAEALREQGCEDPRASFGAADSWVGADVDGAL